MNGEASAGSLVSPIVQRFGGDGVVHGDGFGRWEEGALVVYLAGSALAIVAIVASDNQSSRCSHCRLPDLGIGVH